MDLNLSCKKKTKKTGHVASLLIKHQIRFLSVSVSLTCSQRVKEEKELANSGADVERVERLLQPVQLRQSGDQLQDVVLQILHHITTFFFIPA